MDPESMGSHIERLIESLGMAQEASDTAEGIDELNDLVLHQDVSNTVLFTEMGGIQSILDAMRHHIKEPHVVQCGCKLLGNVLLNNDDARSAMAEKKGIQLVIGTMIHHIDDADVQASGCNALACIAGGNETMIADNGGILCVLGAMKLHKENAHVLQHAIGTIGSLAADANAGKMFIDLRGIQLIVQAMRQHLDNTDIQCKGTTLRKLADCDVQAVVDNGGIPSMLNAMRHYSDDLVVLPCTMEALGTMVRVWCVAHACVEDGGVQILLQLMRQHLGSVNVQKFGCLTLALLATHPAFRYGEDYVLEGIPAIIRGMKQHLDDATVQKVAFLAFSSMDRDTIMGRNHGIHCRIIGREGGIPMVIEAMNHHLEDEDLQRLGCEISARFARIQFNLEEIAMADGFSAIINAMIWHDTNRDIQRSGHRALELLVEDWSRTFCHWQSPGPRHNL